MNQTNRIESNLKFSNQVESNQSNQRIKFESSSNQTLRSMSQSVTPMSQSTSTLTPMNQSAFFMSQSTLKEALNSLPILTSNSLPMPSPKASNSLLISMSIATIC